jgi:hypothetical protein
MSAPGAQTLTEGPLLLVVVGQSDARRTEADKGVLERHIRHASIAVEERMDRQQLGVEGRGRNGGLSQPSPPAFSVGAFSLDDGVSQSSERASQASLDIASLAADHRQQLRRLSASPNDAVLTLLITASNQPGLLWKPGLEDKPMPSADVLRCGVISTDRFDGCVGGGDRDLLGDGSPRLLRSHPGGAIELGGGIVVEDSERCARRRGGNLRELVLR